MLASTVLERDRDWLVGEHVVNGGPAVVPGTGYLELMRTRPRPAAPTGPSSCADVIFAAPFVVGEHGRRALLVRPGVVRAVSSTVYSTSPSSPT